MWPSPGRLESPPGLKASRRRQFKAAVDHSSFLCAETAFEAPATRANSANWARQAGWRVRVFVSDPCCKWLAKGRVGRFGL